MSKKQVVGTRHELTIAVRIPLSLHGLLRRMAFERYMTIGEVLKELLKDKVLK